MFIVQTGNHNSVDPLVLVNVYDFQSGGLFMCIYAFVMRFSTRSRRFRPSRDGFNW